MKVPQGPLSLPDWFAEGLPYYSRSFFHRKKFGHRVWKISVDAGFGCPNRDGTCGVGGCVFCDPASFSPSRRLWGMSIREQIDHGVRQMQSRHRAERFLAYFQPGTNTYASTDRLRTCFEEALNHPQVIGLAVGTRPDCVSDAVLDLLAELSRRTWVCIEYGLQSIHARSLAWLRRGHGYDAFLDAVHRSRLHGLEIGVHVILGLPGESLDDMLETARELTRLAVDSVKLHNLYAVHDTPLAEWVTAGKVELPSREQYVMYTVGFLEWLSPKCIVDRLSADAPPRFLVGPAWCSDKSAVRAAIEAEFGRRRTWQGYQLTGKPSH